MEPVTIRVADIDDFEEAREVLRAAYAEYEGSFPAESWIQYLADILDLEGRAGESELIVAERGGRIVGCVSYFPPGGKASYPTDSFSEPWPSDWSAFRLLAVDPEVRGGGIGRALTEACIKRSRELGAQVHGLHTTAPMRIAREMYERMGFERVARYDFRPDPEVLVEAYCLTLR